MRRSSDDHVRQEPDLPDDELEYGDGGHNMKHGGAIVPDTLRWLWRDWKDNGAKHK